MFICKASAFAAIITAAKQHARPNNFAVTVVVVALGRSLYFLSRPPPKLLAQLFYYCKSFFRSATESINGVYLNHLRFRDCQRGCLHRALVYFSLKTSGIRNAVVSEKGDHPSSAISKGHNSKDTQDSEPAALWSLNPSGRTAVVRMWCSVLRKQL